MAGLIPLLLLVPVLIAVGYFDLRYMRIPNALVLAAMVLFVITLPALGWGEAGHRALMALMVFGIGFVLYALGLFGGGDVKMMAALMLFVPSGTYALFGLVFSAAMLAGMAVVILLRQMPALEGGSWISFKQRGTFPMGVSIALMGLAHPVAVFILASG